MSAIAVPAFALSWWAACYLVGRDPARPALQRAAAALVAYAVAVASWTIAPDSAVAQVLLCVPALLWAGAAILVAISGHDLYLHVAVIAVGAQAIWLGEHLWFYYRDHLRVRYEN